MGSQSPEDLITVKCNHCATEFTIARKHMRTTNYCNNCK
jgi:hypothetical protein